MKKYLTPILIILTVGILASGLYFYQNTMEPNPSLGSFTLSIDFAGLKSNETKVIDINEENLFDLMLTHLNLTYENYSGLGHLITGIDGVISNRNLSNYFWIFYVNGERSNIGVDLFYPQDGDVVLWIYETF